MIQRRKIKVLVVDDSIVFREAVARGIAQDFGIEVVGTAGDPYVARDKILELEPDVITLDVEMPKMNGIEFLAKLMPQYPLPVVVVSSASSNIFEALNAGAVDFVTKPDSSIPGGLNSFINELIVKIKIASMAKVDSYKKDYTPIRPISLKGSSEGQRNLYVKCFKGEKVSGHCPSVDVLFDSISEINKIKSIGVILTGMGSDGAKGLLKMKKNGAFTIGQDQNTSVVYGMPMVAFNIGAVEKQLPLESIPEAIYSYLR